MTAPVIPLPSDVELESMDFMPLFDQRLVRSRAWLAARNWRGDGPGLGFVHINLWRAAFRDAPAGSLEDDEDMLARAADVSIENWHSIRDLALRGWVKIDGRWHHPVVSEIVWELWQTRLRKRHENANLSHRAAAKRAMDAGREPPEAPGTFIEWLERTHPQTALYIRRSVRPGDDVATTDSTGRSGNTTNIRPKRSEGNIPPCSPPTAERDGEAGRGFGTDDKAEGRKWFRAELNRLRACFGNLANPVISGFNRPGVGGAFGFVGTFKGGWLALEAGVPVLVLPSKKRADAVDREHGAWLRQLMPDLKIRHATVDELRAFKKRFAA